MRIAIVCITMTLLLLVPQVAPLEAQQPAAPKTCFDQSAGAAPRMTPIQSEWITDLTTVPTIGTRDRTARLRVSVRDVRVDGVGDGGFWIIANEGGCRLFVIPAERDLIRVHRGELVSLQGEIRVAAVATSDNKSSPQRYLYSYTVRPAW